MPLTAYKAHFSEKAMHTQNKRLKQLSFTNSGTTRFDRQSERPSIALTAIGISFQFSSDLVLHNLKRAPFEPIRHFTSPEVPSSEQCGSASGGLWLSTFSRVSRGDVASPSKEFRP